MNATPVTFFQKWDNTFSVEAEQSHRWQGFYCDMAVVAIGVGAVALVLGTVALAVLNGIIVSPEAALSVGSLATYIVTSLAIKVGKPFYDWASYRNNLANQAYVVREEYEKLRHETTVSCPEGEALSRIWEQNYAKPTYDDFLLAKNSPSNTIEYKRAFYQKEIDAATKRVEYIFWKTLAKNNEIFKRVFLEHGTNTAGFIDPHNAISKFAVWDSRTEEGRLLAILNQDSDRDILLTFNNPGIQPIFYSSILRNDQEGFYNEQQPLEQDFLRALTENREEAV